jgi:hypothetical protein
MSASTASSPSLRRIAVSAPLMSLFVPSMKGGTDRRKSWAGCCSTRAETCTGRMHGRKVAISGWFRVSPLVTKTQMFHIRMATGVLLEPPGVVVHGLQKPSDGEPLFVATLDHGSFGRDARIPRLLSPSCLGPHAPRELGVITTAKSTSACTMHAAQNGANRAGPDNADWMAMGWLLTCMMLQVSES